MDDVSNSDQPRVATPPARPLHDPIDLERELRYGWRLFKRNKGDAILAPLIMAGLLFALLLLTLVPLFLALASNGIGNPLLPGVGPDLLLVLWQLGFMVVFMPALAWLSLGETKVFLKLARRKRPRPRDMFVTGAKVLPALIAYSLANAAAQVAVVAFFIGSIAAQMGLSLSIYYIVDRDLGPVASLHASADACWNWRTIAKLFMLYLVLQFGALTVVGLIVIMPVAILIFTTIYLRLSSRVTCVHCGAKVPRRVAPCPSCHGELTVVPAGPDGVDELDVAMPARTPPRWINPVALLLLVPLIAAGLSPWGGAFQGMALAPRYLNVHPLLGVGLGLGVVIIPLLAALLLLEWQYRGFRAVNLDEAGAVFGRSKKWEGIRVRWRRVRGFRITGAGSVRLQIKRQPWTRWIGPVIPTGERETHDLVVALEARGLYNLEG